MTTIIPQKVKEFDEVEFLRECTCRFPEIRTRYHLDEDTLKAAMNNPLLEKMAEIVMDGFTEHGILKMAKGMSAWKFRIRGGRLPFIPFGVISGIPIPFSQCDPTDNMVCTVSDHYEGTCRALRRKINELKHL